MSDNNPVTSKKGLAILHIIAFVLVIVLNTLAVVLPLNGKSTGQLSDQYPNLFTPAGLTFSILSLIYLSLLGFIVFQLIVLFKTRHSSREKILNISRPFIVNCLANASWIVAWHYELVFVSVCIMLIILISLITIHERLHLALSFKKPAEKLLLDFPFSLYLGWISIATIANITALLVHLRWNGAGIAPYWWTVVMITIGTILNVYLVLFKNNIAFGLVGIWAFIGIILKRQLVNGENSNHIIFFAQVGVSLIAVSIILKVFQYWKQSSDAWINHEKIANPES